MKKQLEENEKAMKDMQQSYEDKLAAAQAGVNQPKNQIPSTLAYDFFMRVFRIIAKYMHEKIMHL